MLKRMTTRFFLAAAASVALACSTKSDDGVDSTAAAGPPPVPGTSDGPAMPPATANAEMQAVLDTLGGLGGKPIESLSPGEARKQPTPTNAVMAVLKAQGKSTAPDPAVGSTDRNISVDGRSLPVRIYTPKAGTGPFPVVVYYHGGGWVIGSKEVYDGGARGIAKSANAVVVSVDYRLGPENKFPAAHDDAYAAYQWAIKNAASIKGDPNKVAVAGESAGGNLAVATAMTAKQKGTKLPAAIIAVYPVAGGDTVSASYTENANAKPLNRAMVPWFVKHYFADPSQTQDPRINLVAADLSGLPPTTIINAQIDPLRSDGEELAEKLRAAGVAVEQRTFAGVNHEFFGMGAVLNEAREAQTMAGNALKNAFGAVRTGAATPASGNMGANTPGAPAGAPGRSMSPPARDSTAMKR
ncbi:MAG: alpha/beta hydrolase [Gemmatimonadaceae bacterium]